MALQSKTNNFPFSKEHFEIYFKKEQIYILNKSIWMRCQMIDEGNWNAGGERWDVLIANQWSLIYQPHGYIQKVSACMKFLRSWNSPTIFWSHWNAKACRYRFVLMGANTRGDTPVVSLIAFNDSIRVLSPLCHLVSVQIWNHNPHRNIYCWHRTSLIINYQLFSSHILNIFWS